MTTTGGEGQFLFVDTNVFIYAINVDSPWHMIARRRLGEARVTKSPSALSPQIIRECLVTLTRPGPDGTRAPAAIAIENVERIRRQSNLLGESSETIDHLMGIVRNLSVAGKAVHDANIVATMLTHDVRRLLTHNVADFRRYANLIELVPLVP